MIEVKSRKKPVWNFQICNLFHFCEFKIKMDKYERIRVVGRGAFGTVYLCRRHSDKREVIIKVILETNICIPPPFLFLCLPNRGNGQRSIFGIVFPTFPLVFRSKFPWRAWRRLIANRPWPRSRSSPPSTTLTSSSITRTSSKIRWYFSWINNLA